MHPFLSQRTGLDLNRNVKTKMHIPISTGIYFIICLNLIRLHDESDVVYSLIHETDYLKLLGGIHI
eukprot:GAHX01002265.1.p1 GENE.GAHX01002265.1~~GAHX01002265.1.p1  ORF type:complete len:66 (-),score=1.28 GAHX01002265.1:209-406(-)